MITFLPSAIEKLAEIMADENNPELKLRIFIQGGGCSGFQYGFTLDQVVNEDDHQIQAGSVGVLVDSMSLQYLMGAEVSYVEELLGAQFKISNPNAQTTCGCGASFSVG